MVADGKITLERPNNIEACFKLLFEDKVDAVALNKFTGPAKMASMGGADRGTVVLRPISIEGIYVFIHKTHPRAQELLALINKGLRGIKANGEHQQIIGALLPRIWAEF